MVLETLDKNIISEIKQIMTIARENVARHINNELLLAYWQIGKTIVEYEQNGNVKAKYGEKLIIGLSKRLTQELGKGFSRSNIKKMRALFIKYQKSQTLSGDLSWSHYCELLSISDDSARSFYEKEATNSKWSVRELKRQIATSLFERLLLSKGDANKEQVLQLAQEGITYHQPQDILRDPYVFEFLALPEDKPVLEKDLEKALIMLVVAFENRLSILSL